jgi:hypothetical protein
MEATQDSRLAMMLVAVETIESLRGGLTLDLVAAQFPTLRPPRIFLSRTGLYEKKEGLIHPA